MAQLPCIGVYKPCINLPFGDCAMYFDYGVYILTIITLDADLYYSINLIIFVTVANRKWTSQISGERICGPDFFKVHGWESVFDHGLSGMSFLD